MEKRISIDLSVKTIFIVLASIFAVWLVYFLRDILVLFFVALILATALEPVVNFLEKRKVPRVIGIISLYIFVIFLIFILVRLIIPPMSAQVTQLVTNREVIFSGLETYFEKIPLVIQDSLVDFWNDIPEKMKKYSSSEAALSGALGIFSGLLGAVTIVVISFYLLLERGALLGAISGYWPIKTRARAVSQAKKMIEKVSLWARGQLILSGSIGILTYIGLTLLGIDYALTLALIAAVTELFPIIGPTIGAIPAIIIALTISPVMALAVLALYVGVQQFESHVLVPQVMKRVIGLSPVIIILSIMIGAKLLGFLGIVIAIPVASAITVLLKSTETE